MAHCKFARLSYESYGRKDYIQKRNIFHVCLQFRARFGLSAFAGNYSPDRRFAGSQWLCKCREAREEESHLLSGQCSAYGDLALQYSDLTKDDSLVIFLKLYASQNRPAGKGVMNPVGGETPTLEPILPF